MKKLLLLTTLFLCSHANAGGQVWQTGKTSEFSDLYTCTTQSEASYAVMRLHAEAQAGKYLSEKVTDKAGNMERAQEILDLPGYQYSTPKGLIHVPIQYNVKEVIFTTAEGNFIHTMPSTLEYRLGCTSEDSLF